MNAPRAIHRRGGPAIPAISTGVYGYPPEPAAAVAIKAVLGAGEAVPEVRFVLFDMHVYQAFERDLAEFTR